MVSTPLFELHDSVDEKGKPTMECHFHRDMEAEEPLDRLMDLVQADRVTAAKALSKARALLKADPLNLELNNYLGCLLWDRDERDDRDEAADVWGEAFAWAGADLPSNAKLRISWYELNNRPFLRLGKGHVLGLLYRGQTAEALAIARKLLRWCPSDNLGVRYLIPDLQYDLGDLDAALKGFLALAPEQPTLWYAAGRVAFQREQFVQACTYIRRGIAGNPYVAEGLTGRTALRDHIYWHASNLYGQEFAVDFLVSGPGLMTSEQVDFVDWVFNCSDVLRERAELMTCHEALTYLHDPSKRIDPIQKRDAILASIDDRLSEKLVCKVRNRWGEEIWPWDRLGHSHPAGYRRGVQVHCLSLPACS